MVVRIGRDSIEIAPVTRADGISTSLTTTPRHPIQEDASHPFVCRVTGKVSQDTCQRLSKPWGFRQNTENR